MIEQPGTETANGTTMTDVAGADREADVGEDAIVEISGSPSPVAPGGGTSLVTSESRPPSQGNPGGQVFDADSMVGIVKKSLDDQSWNYEVAAVNEERVIIKAGCRGLNGSYGAIMDIKEERQIFIIYIRSQIQFPNDNLNNLAFFLTRANYGLTCGNFELDMNDGEVRYKNSLNVSGGVLSQDMVQAAIHAATLTMDKYYGCIVKVAYNAMSPDAAIQEIEGTSSGYANQILTALGRAGDAATPVLAPTQ